jgi:hypothetical protein
MHHLPLYELKVSFNAIAPFETTKTAPEKSNTKVRLKFIPRATELQPAAQRRRFTMQASYQTNKVLADNDSTWCLEGSRFKCGSSGNVLLLVFGSLNTNIQNARLNPLTPNDLYRRRAVSPLKNKIRSKNMREKPTHTLIIHSVY